VDTGIPRATGDFENHRVGAAAGESAEARRRRE
jgi:hypothetical protein